MHKFKRFCAKTLAAALLLSCIDVPGFDLVEPMKVFAAGSTRFVTDTYDSYQELLNLVTMNNNNFVSNDGKINAIATDFLTTFNERISDADFLAINRYSDSSGAQSVATDEFGNDNTGVTDMTNTLNWDNAAENNGSIPDPRNNGIYTFKQRRIEATGQIKSGRWLTDTNYEAMSGTPTTESLFVTLGGSHYLVDLQYRYLTANYKRKYTFNANARNYKYYSLNKDATYDHHTSVHYTATDSVPYDKNSDLYSAVPMKNASGSESTYYNFAYRYFEGEPSANRSSMFDSVYNVNQDTKTTPGFTDLAGTSRSGLKVRYFDGFYAFNSSQIYSGGDKWAQPVAHHALKVTADDPDSTSQSDYKPPDVARAILTKREIVNNINALKKAFYESASKCQDDNYRADEKFYDKVEGLDNNNSADLNSWMYTYGGLVRGNTVDYRTKAFGTPASSGDTSYSKSIYDPVITTYLYDHNNHTVNNMNPDYGSAAVKMQKIKDLGISNKELSDALLNQLKDSSANSSYGSTKAYYAFPINFKQSLLHSQSTTFGTLSNLAADTTYASYASKFTGADALIAISDFQNCLAFGAPLGANKINMKTNLKQGRDIPFSSTYNMGGGMTLDLDNGYGYDELAALYWRALYNMAINYGCLFYYDEAVELFSMDGKYLPGFPIYNNGNPGYELAVNNYQVVVKGAIQGQVAAYNAAVNRNLAAIFGYGNTNDFSTTIKVPFAMFPPGGDLDGNADTLSHTTDNKPVNSYSVNDVLTSDLVDQSSLYTFDLNVEDTTGTGMGNSQPNNDTAYQFYTKWHYDQYWPIENNNAATMGEITWRQYCCGHTVGDAHSWPTPYEDWWHAGTARKTYQNSYLYSRGITTNSEYYSTNVSKAGGQFHICSMDGDAKGFQYSPHDNQVPNGYSWNRPSNWEPHWVNGTRTGNGSPSPSVSFGGRSKDDATHWHWHFYKLNISGWNRNASGGHSGEHGGSSWSRGDSASSIIHSGYPYEDAGTAQPDWYRWITDYYWWSRWSDTSSSSGGYDRSRPDYHTSGYGCSSRNWVHHVNNKVTNQYSCEGWAGVTMQHPNAHTSSCGGEQHYHGSMGNHGELQYVGRPHLHYYANSNTGKRPVNQTPVNWSSSVTTTNNNYSVRGIYKKNGVEDPNIVTISNHVNRDYLYTYDIKITSKATINAGEWSPTKEMKDSQTITQNFTNTQWLDITSYKVYEMKDATIGGLTGLLGTPVKVAEMDNVSKVVNAGGADAVTAVPENRIVTKAVEQLGYTVYNVDNDYTASSTESLNHGSSGSNTETQFSKVPYDVNNMQQLGIVANSWYDRSIGHIGDTYTYQNSYSTNSDGHSAVFPYVAYYRTSDVPELRVGELVNNDMAAYTLQSINGDDLVFDYNPYAQGGRSDTTFGGFVTQALAHTLYFKKTNDWRTRANQSAIAYGNHLRIQSDYLSLERIPQNGDVVNRLTMAGAMHDMWDERGIKTGDTIYSSGKFSLLPNGFTQLSVYNSTDGWIPARMSVVLARTSRQRAYQYNNLTSTDDGFIIHAFCHGINQANHNSWDEIASDNQAVQNTARDIGSIQGSKSISYSPYSATNADNGVQPVSGTITRTYLASNPIRLSDVIYSGMQNGFWASFASPRSDMPNNTSGLNTGITPAYADHTGNIFVVGDYYLNESQNYNQIMTDRKHLQTDMPYVGYQSHGDGTRDIDRDGNDTSVYQKGYDPGFNNIYDTRTTLVTPSGFPEEYTGAHGFSRFGATPAELLETTSGNGLRAGSKGKYAIEFSKYYPNISDVNLNRYLPNNEYAVGQATVNYQLELEDDDKAVYGTTTVNPYKSVTDGSTNPHIMAHYFRRAKGSTSIYIDDSKATVPAGMEGTSTTTYDTGSKNKNQNMVSRINQNLIKNGAFEFLNNIVVYNPTATESAHVITASEYMPDAANQGTDSAKQVSYSQAYLKSFEATIERDTRLGYTYNKLDNKGGKEQYLTGSKILTVQKQVSGESTFVYQVPSYRETTAYTDSDYNTMEDSDMEVIQRIWDNTLPGDESSQLNAVDITESGTYTLAYINRLNHRITVDVDLQEGDRLTFYKGETKSSDTGWEGRNQAVMLTMGTNNFELKWSAYKEAFKLLQTTSSNPNVINYPESSMDVGIPLYTGSTFAVGTGSWNLRKGSLLRYQISVSNTYHTGYTGIKNAIEMADLHNSDITVTHVDTEADPDNPNATLYTWYLEATDNTSISGLFFNVKKDCFIWSTENSIHNEGVYLVGLGQGSDYTPVDSISGYEFTIGRRFENAWNSVNVHDYYNKLVVDLAAEYTYTAVNTSTIVRLDLILRRNTVSIGYKDTIEDPHKVPSTDWRHYVVGWSTDATSKGVMNGIIATPNADCLFIDTTKLYLPSGKLYDQRGYVTVGDMKTFVAQGRLAAFLSNSSTWELFLLDNETINDPNLELHGELTNPHLAGSNMSNMFQGYTVSSMQGWNYTFATSEYGLEDRTNRVLPAVEGDNYSELGNVVYNIIFRCTDHTKSAWQNATSKSSWIAYDVKYTANRQYKYTMAQELELIEKHDQCTESPYWDWKVESLTRLVFSEDTYGKIKGTYQSLDDEFNIYWDNYSNIITQDQTLSHTNQNGEGTATNLENTTIWLGRGWDNLDYSQNKRGPNGAQMDADHMKIPETWNELLTYPNGFWASYEEGATPTVTDTTRWLYAKYVIFNVDMYAFCPKEGVSYVYDSTKIDEYIKDGLWDPTTPAYAVSDDETNRKRSNDIIYIPAGERVFLGYYNTGTEKHSDNYNDQSRCDGGHFIDFGANNSASVTNPSKFTTKSPNQELYTYHFWVPLSVGESDAGVTVQYVAEAINGLHNWTAPNLKLTSEAATTELENELNNHKYDLHPYFMSEYAYQPTNRVGNIKRVVDTYMNVNDKDKVLQSYALPRAGKSGTILDDFGNFVVDTFGIQMINNKGFYASYEPIKISRDLDADPVSTTPVHKMIDYPQRYGVSVNSSEISIVGRIGGLVTVDSEDPRYQDTFKWPDDKDKDKEEDYNYAIAPIVHAVTRYSNVYGEAGSQRRYLYDMTDVRGRVLADYKDKTNSSNPGYNSSRNADSYYISWYLQNEFKEKDGKSLNWKSPVTTQFNIHDEMRYDGNGDGNNNSLMTVKLGYNLLCHLNTIGNYFGSVSKRNVEADEKPSNGNGDYGQTKVQIHPAYSVVDARVKPGEFPIKSYRIKETNSDKIVEVWDMNELVERCKDDEDMRKKHFYSADVYMRQNMNYYLINAGSEFYSRENKEDLNAASTDKGPYYLDSVYDNAYTVGLDTNSAELTEEWQNKLQYPLDQKMLRLSMSTIESQVTYDIVRTFKHEWASMTKVVKANILSRYISTTILERHEYNSISQGDNIDTKYYYGNGQMLFLREFNRNFVGGVTEALQETKIDLDTSLTGAQSWDNQFIYNIQRNAKIYGQRWYFQLGLPASAVFVAHGTTPINGEILNGTIGVYIITMIDSYAVGDKWTVHYESESSFRDVIIDGGSVPDELWNTYKNTLPYYIPVCIYDMSQNNAASDLSSRGTH